MIGRFLSVDPVTAYEKPLTNFNRHVYARNNPYKFTDPDGREAGGGYATGQYTMGIEWTPEKADMALKMAVVVYGGAAVAAEGSLAAGLRYVFQRAVGSAARTESRPSGVPETWTRSPSNKQGGEKFRNPDLPNPKSVDEVRSMPGNHSSPNPAQREPYMVRNVDGKFYDASGKQVPQGSVESHIPAKDFKFIPRDQLLKINK